MDALHLSGWRFGHFADGDAFTLFDLGGPVVYRTQLEGGVPCLQWRGSEHAPLPLSDIRAVRIRFPDAATGDLTRRQLLAVDAQGQLHTLLEDSVPPVTVDANQEAALQVHNPEQR